MFKVGSFNSHMQILTEFRPADESDDDAIASIWHSSASLPGVGPADMPPEADLRQRVDRELAAGWRVTVAVREGDIIGFVAIKPKEALLCELFIRPDSLGAGIGRALLEWAKAAMPEGFTLYTRSTNLNARRFYEKMGLVETRQGAHPRTGEPITFYGWNVQPSALAASRDQ